MKLQSKFRTVKCYRHVVVLLLLAISVFTYSQSNPYAITLAKINRFNTMAERLYAFVPGERYLGNVLREIPQWPIPKSPLSPCSSYVESTNSGLLGHLFDVDIVYGNLSFSVAKFVDTVWDVGFGRGAQVLMAWVMYHVLVNSLMWIMESRPVPYHLFVGTTLSAADMASLAHLGRFGTTKMALRHKLLIAWLIFAISWVVVFPVIAGAMTGYINWVDPDTNTLVKLRQKGQYMNLTEFIEASETVFNVTTNHSGLSDAFTVESGGSTSLLWEALNTTLSQLSSNHKNTTISNFTYPCNQTFTLCPSGLQSLNVSCFRSVDNVTYDWTYTSSLENVICTQGFGYQWGFSSLLVSMFLICNTVWLIGMYITWETLELQSEFKKKPRGMGKYRAVVDLGDMIREELGSDISALSDSALEAELKKRLPVRYHVSNLVTAMGDKHAHIGLSSNDHQGEKVKLEYDTIYA